MLHPSYTDLINVVNSDIEPGEQPVVQSRYSIVIAASKRARQLIAGDEPLVAGANGKKPLSIAIDELYHQKVKVLPEEETVQEEEEKRFGAFPVRSGAMRWEMAGAAAKRYLRQPEFCCGHDF